MTPIVEIINGILLLLTFLFALFILRSAALYTLNIGDTPVQKRYVRRILRSILALIVIGLLGAISNIIFTQLGAI